MMFANPICKFTIILSTACMFVITTMTALGQKPAIEFESKWYDSYEELTPKELYKPEHITKKPGHYTITDWQNVIDSTWGWGLLKAQKIQILNNFWNLIDTSFAGFVNHPDYNPGWWDSLKTVYLDEINNGDPTYGVSRGRFAAIMNYLSMVLKDSHTRVKDITVNHNTTLNPGVPLLVPGPYGPNGHFGAGLTPLADSSLLIYKTVISHPLGLVPGDIVLGYDGIPWKQLYKDLLDAQLPIYCGLGWGNHWGSSESAFAHSWLTSAGMNWHLFDSLDVVKYNTGDTVRISVSPLIGQNMDLFCTEQMEIPGVPMPDLNAGERSSFGIISGTQIGYIYVWAWYLNVENEFYDAVNTLINDYETTGLIIDFRLDYWGYMHLANKGFAQLYNTREPLFGWVERCSPSDHLSLCDTDFSYFNNIYESALTYYDKPIAMLTGPGSFSVGDFITMAVQLHPMVRTFGKSITGALNYYIQTNLGNSSWECNYSVANTYFLNNPGNYLLRTELNIDEEVWFTPTDVAQGYDTVVEAAKSWINSQQGTQPDIAIDSVSFDVTLDYGEVSSESLVISNNGNRTLFYSLTPEIDSGTVNMLNTLPTTMGHGGYDDYGYTWIDSHQPHGPSFNWVDISGVGTPVSLGNNSYSGPINIGFDFPFYGNEYSELFICSNGIISFGAGTGDYSNVNIPDVASPNNFIAPWWDDLNPSAGGGVIYYSDSGDSLFVVSFLNIPKYYYGGHSTFQVILNTRGQIRLNYINMELGTDAFFDFYTATVGIENSDGSDGLEIYYNAPYTIDSLSILITTDWLAVNPYSSYIAPGENEIASVTFSARHLALGTYTGNIFLDSNDPVDSLIIIPVSLTVTGGCDYVTGDVNGSDSYNGLDITYGVNFFKGGNDPMCEECGLCPNWHYCGDVNGSCSYNGLDITYGVAYFKGGPDPIPCADCPPVE